MALRFGKATLLGAAGAFFISSAAIAADVPEMPMAAPPAPAPMVETGFEWAGPYVGAVAASLIPFPDTFTILLGVSAGYNLVFDRFLVGASVTAERAFGDDDSVALIGATRAGLLLGDRVLAYGELQIIHAVGDGTTWGYAGGLEIGLGQSVSVFGQLGQWILGGLGGPPLIGTIGVNFHLGN